MQVWKSYMVIQLSRDLSKPPNHLIMHDHLICISFLDALLVYLFLIIVITVSRLTWMTTKINEVAIDLFCTGVIDHPRCMFLS